ncbi:hypothetical protein GCM10008929_13140 [Alkalibacterium psychrotolerans]
MKVLFCHDGPLRVDREKNYYGNAHNNDTFMKYYSIAEYLIVIMRQKEILDISQANNLSKITLKPFEFISVPNMMSFKGRIFGRRKAKEIIKTAVDEADFIVARLPSQTGLLAIDIARNLNKPYLIELVGSPWDSLWYHSNKGKLLAPFVHFSTKKRVKESNFTVYVTNKYLQDKYPTLGHSTNCSNVVLKEKNEETLKRRIEKIENLKSGNKIIIGTIGAINIKYKGQKDIIKALSKLKKEGITNYEYHLVGGGDISYLERTAIKYDVSDQVIFRGVMKHSNVVKWLDTIDVYAQPSKTEGLPRALIEAMNSALPAIGTNVGGIPELLDTDVIFSKRSNIKQIYTILKNMDNKKMLEQAIVNYKKSKEYKPEYIQERRELFFNSFIKNH